MGEDVVVFTRQEVGRDDCDEPIYEWPSETVSNVLVRPLASEELEGLEDVRPDGMVVRYRLAFPKTYTGSLAYARISLVERGMSETDYKGALRVNGDPDILRPCPTRWNRLVDVGCVNG